MAPPPGLANRPNPGSTTRTSHQAKPRLHHLPPGQGQLSTNSHQARPSAIWPLLQVAVTYYPTMPSSAVDLHVHIRFQVQTIELIQLLLLVLLASASWDYVSHNWERVPGIVLSPQDLPSFQTYVLCHQVPVQATFS